MAGCVAVDVLGIDVSPVLDECLNDTQVASQTGDVQRSTEVVGPCIDLRAELDQDLDQRGVAFTGRQMERSEPIRVGAVHDLEHLVLLVEVLLGEGQDLDYLGAIALVDLRPVVHLDFLDVLLPVLLLLRLFALA